MKIAYLSADLGVPLDGYKGAAAHVRGMVTALAAVGHEMVVVAPAPAGDAGLPVPLVRLRVPDIARAVETALPRRLARALAHLWNNVVTEEALARVVASHRPDLVYERYGPFGVAGALVARRHGLPHVLEVNAPLAWEGERFRAQALLEAARALERAALEATARIVAVSAELAEILVEQGVPREKIEVVPNGVDAELFTPDGPAAGVVPERACVVGFVGSLKPWHGVDVLASAFRALAGDSRFHLLVVGDGPQAGIVEALARELPGRVTRVGGVAHREVPRYLRAMDIAVAPYPALERFYYSPLKVLEYMASGRALVASDIGQVRELVGEAGVLVPPGHVGALVEAIRRLAASPGRREELGALAAREAARAHRWTDRAARIGALLEAACAR